MTLVNISLVDLGGAPSRGDYVTIWSPAFRGSGERLVSTAAVRVPLHEGVGQIDLQPGEARIRFHCRDLHGEYTITVPQSGPVSLGTILGGTT